MQPRSPSELVGIPFKDGGRDLDGLDCWGLIMQAGKFYGDTVPDFRISIFAHALIDEAVDKHINELVTPTDERGPGVYVALAQSAHMPDAIQHFGVMVDKRRFVHAVRKLGVIVSKIDDPEYVHKVKGFYKWKK